MSGFYLAITAGQRCNVLFDPYLFEAQPRYFVPTRPQSSPVYLLRLVASRIENSVVGYVRNVGNLFIYG